MKDYNWWEDPKNAEEIKQLSWWEHPENKKYANFPISVIQTGKHWTATSNAETKELIGDIGGVASGLFEEEAIKKYWKLIKFHIQFIEEKERSYQRWVPFRKGPWGKVGGNWFAIFGIHVYFRYEKRIKMQGGFYIPFTKLNVSFSNDWVNYNRWKKRNKSV